MYCQRMGSLFRVLINRHSVRAVIPAIGLSFALNEWSDKQWSRQWLGTNTANMMCSRDGSSTAAEGPTLFSDELFGPFVSLKPVFTKTDEDPRENMPYVLGSGFIYDPKGYVLTRAVTCKKFNKFVVRLGNGEEALGTMWFTEPKIGFSVIQLAGNRDNWPVVNMIDKGSPPIGQFARVMVVSNPSHGLYNHLTDALIENNALKGTHFLPFRSHNDVVQQMVYMQHSALLNDSDMGTALLDLKGRVIGFNYYRHTDRMVLAIHIHTILDMIPSRRPEDGPLLNTMFCELTAGVRQRLKEIFAADNRPTDQLPAKGIVLWDFLDTDINVWSTRFALKRYDVITAINGEPVHQMDDLYRAVDDFKDGVEVVIEFDGRQKKVILDQTFLDKILPTIRSFPTIVCV